MLRVLSIPTAAAAVVAALGRLAHVSDPLGVDANVYLTVARGWLDDLVPYQDLFESKGPLVYVFLAGVEAVAPASIFAVRVAFLAAVVASAALLAALVERHAGRRVAWATAVVYALASSSPLWQFNDVNTEQLSLPFMVAAVDFADRYCLFGRWWQAFGAGAAVAACVWVKPSVAFVGALVLVLLVTRPDRRVAGALVAVFGGIVASAATLAPFAASNALGSMRWALNTYNHDYVVGGFDDLFSRSLGEQIAWALYAPGSAFFVAALTMGALAWALGRHRRLVAIGTAWLLLEYAGAKVGVRDFDHYFGPLVAPCAILICTGANALAAHLTGIGRRARTALAVAVWLPLATFLVINLDIQRLARGTDPSIEVTNQVDDILEDVTSRDARIFVAGANQGYQSYWLTDRTPAIRFFWAEVMGASPYTYDRRYLDIARESLKRDPPVAIVIWPDSYAHLDNYVQPAIKRGALNRVATIPTAIPGQVVQIFARQQAPSLSGAGPSRDKNVVRAGQRSEGRQ